MLSLHDYVALYYAMLYSIISRAPGVEVLGMGLPAGALQICEWWGWEVHRLLSRGMRYVDSHLQLCIYMCIYACLSLSLSMYIYTYIYIYTFMYDMCIYVYMHIYICAYIYIYIYIYREREIDTYVSYLSIYIYIHICRYIYIYAYTHILYTLYYINVHCKCNYCVFHCVC